VITREPSDRTAMMIATQAEILVDRPPVRLSKTISPWCLAQMIRQKINPLDFELPAGHSLVNLYIYWMVFSFALIDYYK
jgi:hypothetical protein